MKKRCAMVLAALSAVCLLAGCGKEVTALNSEERINYFDVKLKDYVTLGEYKNLNITIVGTTYVSNEEVEMQTLLSYQQYVTKENGAITDRAVAYGDTVLIDYLGKKGGVAFAGGEAKGVLVSIGSGAFIEGFEEGLIGAMPGENMDLNLTFPEDYQNMELAGQKVVFEVAVHYIVPDEMTDSVVAGFDAPEYATVDEFMQYTKAKLEQYYEQAYRENVERTIYSRIYSNSSYQEFPETLLTQRMEHVQESIEADAQEMNMDVDTLISMYYGMSKADFLEQVAESCLYHILTAYAIAEKENILQTRRELDLAIEQYAAREGFSSVEEMLEAGGTKADLEEQVMLDAVLDFLMENTNIKTVSG